MTRDEIDAIVRSTPFRRFHNAIRIMHSIDKHEFDERRLPIEWIAFRDDPLGHFIACDDTSAAAIWTIVDDRQPPELKEPRDALTAAAADLALAVSAFARALDEARANSPSRPIAAESAALADVHLSLVKLDDAVEPKAAER
jgi:hypothetical protein